MIAVDVKPRPVSNDQVTIRYPKAGTKVPGRFVAAGAVLGNKAKGVRAKLVKDGESIGAARLLSFQPVPPHDDLHRWMVLFDNIPDGVYQLEVIGVDGAGNPLGDGEAVTEVTVSGCVGGALLTIDYPADGQNVSDQRNDLMCYGSTDTEVVCVTAGDTAAESIMNYPDIDFWTGEFPPLGAGLTLQITVTDVDNDHAQITVYT